MMKKYKLSELIFIVVMFICSIRYINGAQIGIQLTNVAALFWVLYSLTLKKRFELKKIARFNFKITVFPILFMVGYTCVLWLFKPPVGAGTTITYFIGMLAPNAYLVLYLLFAYTAFSVFGRSTVKLVWTAMALNYVLLSIIPALIFCGPIDIINYLIFAKDNTIVGKYLEVHDVTFAFGILFIYYFVIGYKHRTSYNIKILILTAIFIFMGYKRIEIAAIILILMYYYIIDINFKNLKKKTFVMTTIVLVGSLVFIWSIYSGLLVELASKYQIEFSYRLDTWSYWANRSSFGLLFPGLGQNFVDKESYLLYQMSGILQNGYVLVAGMHSDIYKKYVELGFIVYNFWIIYIIYTKTIRLNRYFGKLCADIYLIITLYVIILYFTDNVYNYFATNVCYLSVVMVMCLMTYKSDTEKETELLGIKN